jgi:hypothetical protein
MDHSDEAHSLFLGGNQRDVSILLSIAQNCLSSPGWPGIQLEIIYPEIIFLLCGYIPENLRRETELLTVPERIHSSKGMQF